MKKFLLGCVAIICAFGTARAQYTPKAGDISTEITISSLFEDPKFNLNNNSIRGRYFLSDDMAVRAALSFGLHAVKDYDSALKDDFNDKNFDKDRNSAIGISAGLERHFNLSDRLNAYIGAEVSYSRNSNKSVDSTKDNESIHKSHANVFGAAAVTGLDFYVYKQLYLGAEFGLQYNIAKDGNSTYKYDGKEKEYKDPDVTTNLGLFCTPAIRLGWFF